MAQVIRFMEGSILILPCHGSVRLENNINKIKYNNKMKDIRNFLAGIGVIIILLTLVALAFTAHWALGTFTLGFSMLFVSAISE